MPRTKRAELDTLLGYLCAKVGKPHGHVPGGWFIDYAPIYGGYEVRELGVGNTGQSHPFSSGRMPAREMADCLRFALDAVYWATQA